MQTRGTSAVVTGAASGLGARAAALLASQGVTVLGLDLAASIWKAEPVDGVRLVAADVTSEEDVLAALGTLDGSAPLRIAINCAGIAPQERTLGRTGPHSLATFRTTIEVNLIGTFNVLRLAAARIAEAEPVDDDGQRGVIVNTASVAAYEGQIGQVAYAASKGGVVGLTIAAARDLARSGIRVVTIAPGIVATPMLSGLGEEVSASLGGQVPFPARLARPDEYARLVTMVIEHDYLNGETIRMDGAIRMGPR